MLVYLLTGSVPPPNITNTSVNCSGGLVEWVAPELEDGSEVAHYTLWIKRPNITHELTNSTRMMVPFDGLMYNEEYEFSVYASHCGRKGESAFGTIRTAMGMSSIMCTCTCLWLCIHVYMRCSLYTYMYTCMSYSVHLKENLFALSLNLVKVHMYCEHEKDETETMHIDVNTCGNVLCTN